MAAFVIIGLIATAIFFVVLFCSPDSPEVTLASLTVTKFNFTGDHISGNLNLHFQVQNPNLYTDFFYEDVSCSVYNRKNRVASTVFPGFVQKARETTPINVTFHLTPGITTARGIGKDLTTYNFAEFDVKLATFIKCSPWSGEYVRISCNDVAVGLLNAAGGHGKMIGSARKCKVS